VTEDPRWTLVLIDLQNDYFPGGRNPLEGSDAAVLCAGRLLERARALGRPVVHVRHLATAPDAPFFRAGTPGAAIHEAVRPGAGEPVVEKHFPNAFRETSLLASLREAGAEKLVFAGMMTHMCVDATVRAAVDLGFAAAVAGDACATKPLVFGETPVPAAQVHAAFLSALAAAYAEVRTTADLLGRLA